MKATDVIKALKRGIELYGNLEVEISRRRGRLKPVHIGADEKRKTFVIRTEEDDYDTGD